MVTQALVPAGYLLSGVLADQLLEPAMATEGWLVGVGPGRGITLMFIGSALCAIIICLGAYLVPAIRCVEDNPSLIRQSIPQADHREPAM